MDKGYLSEDWDKNALKQLNHDKINPVQLNRCAMPNISFTTALAIGTQSQRVASRDAGLFTWFWAKPNYSRQLRTELSRITIEDAKKFIQLLIKHQASPLFCEDAKNSAWACRLLDATAYPIIIAYITLAQHGADLPLEFKSQLEWRGAPIKSKSVYLADYAKRQHNRKIQDAAIKTLTTESSIEHRLTVYVQYAHYWLDLAKAIIADTTYKEDHFALDTHIATYFLHQAIRFYQHVLYLDQQDELPSPTDKIAWAKPLGEFLVGKTRVYVRQQLDDRWLKDYMTCLEELAPRDLAFHLNELLGQEKILFAKRLAHIKAAPESSTTHESDDDSQHTDGEPAPADLSPLITPRKH